MYKDERSESSQSMSVINRVIPLDKWSVFAIIGGYTKAKTFINVQTPLVQ